MSTRYDLRSHQLQIGGKDIGLYSTSTLRTRSSTAGTLILHRSSHRSFITSLGPKLHSQDVSNRPILCRTVPCSGRAPEAPSKSRARPSSCPRAGAERKGNFALHGRGRDSRTGAACQTSMAKSCRASAPRDANLFTVILQYSKCYVFK